MKRIVSAFLAIVMLLSVVPIGEIFNLDLGITAYAAGEGVYAKLNSLRSKYPNGYFWNHLVTANSNNGDALFYNGDESFADSVTSSPCATHNGVAQVGQYDCNYFDGGIQCWGFAGKVFYDVFGQRKSGLQKIYNNNYGVSVGDYVRVNNDSHSAVVLSRNGDYITVVECNLSGDGNAALNCKIRWDATYHISSITYYCHATNYSQVDNSSVDYFKSVSASNITETDAKIEATIIGTNLSTCGFYIGKSTSSMSKITETVNGYVEGIWYVMSSDYGQLEPATTYYYKFFITVNGKEYCSEIKSFKTASANYTVHFESEGGTVSPAKVTVKSGQAVVLPTPTKSYQITYDSNGGNNAPESTIVPLTFLGWDRIFADGLPSGTMYEAGFSYIPSSNVILHAFWDSTVTGKITASCPIREGYNFLGWAESPNATQTVYKANDSIELSEDKILYALWEKIEDPSSATEMTLSLYYKDFISFNKPVAFIETSNSNVAAIEGDIVKAVGIGSADVTVTFEDGSTYVYHINVSFSLLQWIIRIVLFGWIWY